MRSPLLGCVLSFVGGCASLVGADFDRKGVPASADDGGTRPDIGTPDDTGGDASSAFDASSQDGHTSEEAGTDAASSESATPFTVIPSNNGELGAIDPNASRDVVLSANGVFDTTTSCTIGAFLGDCTPITLPSSVDVCVCRVRSITVASKVGVLGSRALAIFAARTVSITGTLDLSADGTASGPGAAREYATSVGIASIAEGGSFGTRGGGDADPTYGTPSLVPLLGGMSGRSTVVGSELEYGGGAGGALQITAGERIEVAATGVIDAGGGGGEAGTNNGAGGGSGGGVLLEAPQVIVRGVVAANGGAGGGGGGNYPQVSIGGGDVGADATTTLTPAPGGNAHHITCSGSSTTGGRGGDGAAGTTLAKPGATGSQILCNGVFPETRSGGSGGGHGRIRINSQSSCNCSGTISPAASFGSVVTITP